MIPGAYIKKFLLCIFLATLPFCKLTAQVKHGEKDALLDLLIKRLQTAVEQNETLKSEIKQRLILLNSEREVLDEPGRLSKSLPVADSIQLIRAEILNIEKKLEELGKQFDQLSNKASKVGAQREARQNNLETLWLKGELHITRFQFDSAMLCFEQVVEAAPDNFRYSCELASLLHKQRQHAEALTMYKKADSLAASSLEKARVLLSLGELYLTKNNLPEARRVYLEAEKIYDHPDLENYKEAKAAVLHGLGNVHRIENKYPEARTFYHKALALYRQALSPHDSFPAAIADVYNNLALVQAGKKEDSATIFFNTAIHIYQRLSKNPAKTTFLTPTEINEHLARIYTNLAEMHYSKKNYLKADPNFIIALDIIEKLAHQNPVRYLPNLVETYDKLEKLYVNLNNTNKALDAFQKRFQAWKKLHKNSDSLFQQTQYVMELGSLYYALQKYPEAKKTYQQAIEDYKQRTRDNFPKEKEYRVLIATIFIMLGNVYLKEENLRPTTEKNFGKVRISYQQALSIYQQLEDEKLYPPDTFFQKKKEIKDKLRQLEQTR